jgi:hypothetical protein
MQTNRQHNKQTASDVPAAAAPKCCSAQLRIALSLQHTIQVTVIAWSIHCSRQSQALTWQRQKCLAVWTCVQRYSEAPTAALGGRSPSLEAAATVMPRPLPGARTSAAAGSAGSRSSRRDAPVHC